MLLDHSDDISANRVYAATAFNMESDVFILVGGTGTEGALPSDGSIYLFDVGQATWQSNPPPPSAPPPTQKAEMVYDSLNHRMLMWGGSDDAGTLSTDLWQFSLGAERWQRVPTKGVLPGGRTGHRMVMDALNRRFIMFGGGAFSETWELRWQ